MNTHEVVESYVCEVARCLPRAKRNDVAFELRTLLSDELLAKAQAAARAPDHAMVMDLLKGFGSPAEVAARYHQRSVLIDSADTHHYLIWALSGAVTLSLLSALSPSAERDNGDEFLKWLGALVIIFAVRGWWRRRPARAMAWKPKRGQDWMPRGLSLLSLVATAVFPLFVYAAPQLFVETMFFGRVVSDGVVLTESFARSGERMAGIVMLGLLVVMYGAVLVQGRYASWSNWTFAALHGALGLLMGAHGGLARAGQVFTTAKANEVAAPIFGVVGTFLLMCAFYGVYQEWARIKPAPEVEGRRG